MENKLTKGQKLYYARIFDKVGIFEVIDMHIRGVYDTYFVCVENRTKHAYLFPNDVINKTVFFNRDEALDLVLEAESNCKKSINTEKYYEEY